MKKLQKILKKIERKRQVDAGFFDGRYKTKVISDKKKVVNKRLCRLKINDFVG